MLKNYFVIALRHLHKRLGYTVINVVGLAVGLACCLLIGLYIGHERSFDHFHEKADRLYRVVIDSESRGDPDVSATTQPVLAPTLRAEVPEVEAAIRVDNPTGLLRRDETQFQEDELLFADAGFFEVFSFPLLEGDPKTALTAPNSIVLTRTAARRYFGDADPIGQTLLHDNERTLTVTAIAADVPANSHLQFEAAISLSTFEEDDGEFGRWNNWFNQSITTYVLLRPDADLAVVNEKMRGFQAQHVGERMTELGIRSEHHLEPITDVRLYSEYGGEGATNGARNLLLFGILAGFVLLIAGMNFVNLTTVQTADRAKEVGVRKVLGSQRGQLMQQFLAEALLLSAGAALLALLLAEMALPLFNDLSGQSLRGDALVQLPVLLALVLTAVVIGLLAGGYPAFVLARLLPTKALRGGLLGQAWTGNLLRQGLVVVQFALSIGLIAATAVVFAQLRHMQAQGLGFNEEQVLVLDFGGDARVRQQLETVKARLASHPDVAGVTTAAYTPASGNYFGAGGELERGSGEMERASVQLYVVDFNFPELYELDLLAGRTFDPQRVADSTGAFILNETAVRAHGFASPEEALGRRAEFWGQEGEIIGVVRDFHHAGLQDEIGPMALHIRPAFFSSLSLRLHSDNLLRTVDELEAVWKEIVPHRPFLYAFLDEQIDAQYRTERQFGELFGVAAGLAVFIACLGLFALAAFSIQRRTKEVGVRKVLGATVPNLVGLLSKDFFRLVLIAFALVTPLVYLVMAAWLEDFATRIVLWEHGLLFLAAGAVALVVALVTVSYHALKAARANPAQSLKYE